MNESLLDEAVKCHLHKTEGDLKHNFEEHVM